MPFVKVPDQLPSPQAYLRAGLTRPTESVTWPRDAAHAVVEQGEAPNLQEITRNSPPGGHTVTLLADSDVPAAVVEGPSQRFLTRPARRWLSHSEVLDVQRHPSGVLDVTSGQRRPLRHPERPGPIDTTTARVVTIDRSVVVAGVDPTLFEPDDALFVSVVIPLEMSVMLGTRPATEEVFTEFGTWDLSAPVPIDEYVLRIYAELSTPGKKSPLRDGTLERSDLLCAATAILYDAPMYTTRKSAYAGLGLGLKTIAYGPVRNRAALNPAPPPDPFAALGIQPSA